MLFSKKDTRLQADPEAEHMREILARVRRIEIRSRRAVQEVMGGEYHSVFKGRGMEFDEVREYEPGDEIRDIDWNVTARTGRAHIKRFVEEREQTVFFVVDLSASGSFGSRNRMKREQAAEICAILAFSAIQNNDRVGLITFSDHIEEMIPPKKGRKHVLRVIRELLFARPKGRGTDMPLALDTLNQVLKRRSIVFVVSDFLTDDFSRPLRMTRRRHDVIAIQLRDEREEVLPPMGIIELEDAETGEARLVDTGSEEMRRSFEDFNRRRLMMTERAFRSIGVDHLPIRTDAEYIGALIKYFRLRAKRR